MQAVFPLEAAKSAPIPEDARSAQIFAHGTMTLKYYAPAGRDPQTPHDQDEIYVVASGSGKFLIGDSEESLASHEFGPGDAIFAAAGAVHRFVDFSDDFAVWVVFWGPAGGEEAAG